MEKRKEYAEGEIINCPKCDSDNLDIDAPDHAKCLDCGQEFSVKQVVIWNEKEVKMNCPDCGTEIKEITVERFQTKTFRIDHEKKILTPVYPDMDWDTANDYAYHCLNCDSLNVDEQLAKYEIEED